MQRTWEVLVQWQLEDGKTTGRTYELLMTQRELDRWVHKGWHEGIDDIPVDKILTITCIGKEVDVSPPSDS